MRTSLVLLAAALLPIGSPALADANSDAILREAFTKLHAAQRMTADMNVTLKIPGLPQRITFKGTVSAMKPNLLRVDLKGGPQPMQAVYFIADGKAYYTNYLTQPGTYQQQPLLAKPTELGGVWEAEIDSFFGGAANAAKAKSTHYGGSDQVGGVACDIVDVKMSDPDRTVVYYIGKADHLIHRTIITAHQDNGTATITDELSGIRLNPPLAAAHFAFKPPAGSHKAGQQRRPDFI